MTMMFGIVKLTNLAHGEFIIMGAFASTLIAQALGITMNWLCGMDNLKEAVK